MDRQKKHIDPDVVFIDAKNLPSFDVAQFEGRIERPISRLITLILIGVVVVVFGIYVSRMVFLQVVRGAELKEIAENNRLQHATIFSDRGIITDRLGTPLVWNEVQGTSSDFSVRRYKTDIGAAHVLGYIKYPAKDTAGFYYTDQYIPQAGVEKFYDTAVRGTHGVKITETDVRGNIISENIVEPAQPGNALTLSIDARLQRIMYEAIQKVAQEHFRGGVGLMMDLQTGELLAHVTYPEFNADLMTNGSSRDIQHQLGQLDHPFLDRISSGLYVPGSIIKPIIALAALNEKTIDPAKKILSTGSISIPNPYTPSKPSIFRDWKAHGWVDMREALAVSSDVYFYAVGGGYADQKGLGIAAIDDYMNRFGFAEDMAAPFFKAEKGVIPTPEWKKKTFNGDVWRLGDTYLTAIGQYGVQVTPIQVLRALSAIATKGTRIEPTIIHNDASQKSLWKQVTLPEQYYTIIHEGMRHAALEGTARALATVPVPVAAKTGTAELGITKDFVNSWVIGFFPYEQPRYAFVVLMERGSRTNLIGASAVMYHVFMGMMDTTPEYIRN